MAFVKEKMYGDTERKSLSINALRTCVYIYIRQVYRTDCRFLPYSTHFSDFMPFFSRGNGQNNVCYEMTAETAVTGHAKH